jgi:hypothetical protein
MSVTPLVNTSPRPRPATLRLAVLRERPFSGRHRRQRTPGDQARIFRSGSECDLSARHSRRCIRRSVGVSIRQSRRSVVRPLSRRRLTTGEGHPGRQGFRRTEPDTDRSEHPIPRPAIKACDRSGETSETTAKSFRGFPTTGPGKGPAARNRLARHYPNRTLRLALPRRKTRPGPASRYLTGTRTLTGRMMPTRRPRSPGRGI